MTGAPGDGVVTPAALDRAIEAHRARLRGPGGDRPEQAEAHCGLAQLLVARYGRLGRVEDLDAAVRAGEQAVGLAEGPDQAATAHGLLGEALRSRFEAVGRAQDIDDAIAHLRRAEAASANRGATERAGVLGSLSNALLGRAERRDDGDDAHAAVAAAEAACDVPGLAPELRPHATATLATAVNGRYLIVHNVADLDRAVELWRRAVEGLAHDDPQRPRYLYNLGGALLHRHHRVGRLDDLDAAIAANRVAIDALPAGHPERSVMLAGLANQLLERARATEDPAALDESIALAARASRVGRPVERAAHLHVYAQGLTDRHQLTDSGRDLRRAVRALRASVRASPPDSPRLPGRLASLALALELLHGRSRQPRHRRRALAAMRRATAMGDADPLAHRLSGALHRQDEDTTRSADAYRTAVALVQRLAWAGLDLVSLQSRLRDVPALASDGAAVLLDGGDPGGAVLLLEQGRTVILSRLLDVRADRSRLAAAHPELCARLDEAIAALAAADRPAPDGDGDGAYEPDDDAAEPDEGAVERRWRLHRRYDELLAEARRQPGFADLMAGPDAGLVPRAASDGPVVVVNVSDHRCDALVLAPGRDGVEVVPLTDLTADDVEAHAQRFLAALATIDATGDPAEADVAAARISATLAWLWRTIGEPVLDHLGHDGAGGGAEPPRLWWCPTGRLALLPLHAAGIHAHPDDRDWVGARVVSSYTPTLGALVRNREAAGPGAGDGPAGALVVAAGDAAPVDGVRFGALRGQGDEVAAVRRHLPGPHTVLDGPEATRRAVRQALGSHAVLHFACHARAVEADPFAGYLALADGPLRARDVMGRLGDDVALCFLSACSTAQGAPDLVDEALHLAAVFSFSGARRVVGTLWDIDDATAPQVADDVYAALARAGGGVAFDAAARGLHRGVARLRRQPATAHPLHWAAYAHFGA